MITYEVHVCIGQDDPEKRVAVKCHDTGVNLMVFLEVCHPGKWRDYTEPYQIPAGSTAVIKIAKPDKTYCVCDGQLVNGGVLFKLPPQSFTAAGVALAEVSLFGQDSRRLTSATFDIHVPEECICDSTEESESYVDVMAEQIKVAVDAAETATEKAQKVEDAVVHSPVISDAGTWLVWDFDKNAYVDTGIAASGGGASENAVLYTEQELTDGQKAQARKNIGAADEAGVGAHTTSWLLENYPDKVKLDESTSTLTIYIGSTDDRNIPFGDYVFNERYEYLSFRTISDDGKTSNNIVRSGVLSNFNSNFSFTCKSKAKSGEFPLYGLTIGGYTYCNFTVDSNGTLHIESTRTLTDTTSVLTRTNKSAYTPTADYHPATKKYVDDAIPTALPSPHALTFTGAVSGSYDGSEGLTVEIPQGGEKWEKIADVTLTKDVGWYILANMGMYRKVKVLLDRPSYISGLNKNVWLRLDGGARQITICYLSAEYGYLHWEVEAEVTESFAISKKIATNNRESADPVKSTGTTLLGATSPSDLDVTLTFTDTSVIQDGDTVTVLGVRR